MIDVALSFLVAEVNAYLFARTGTAGGSIVAGRLVDDGGKSAIPADQIGVALVNVEEERTLKAQTPETALVNGRQIVLQPPLKINLHLIFAANFTQYDVGLRQLSWVLTFFQAHPSFTRDSYPALPERIAKLAVELQSMSFEQLNQVWGAIGGKQLPSVMYRVRLVPLQDTEPSAIQKPIHEIAGTFHNS